MFDGAPSIQETLEKDPTEDRDEALLDLYRKLRPGELTTVESARGLINTLFYNPKRYDLTRVGRYKLNQKFGRPAPGVDDIDVVPQGHDGPALAGRHPRHDPLPDRSPRAQGRVSPPTTSITSATAGSGPSAN